MNEETENTTLDRQKWVRLLYMMLFWGTLYMAKLITAVVVVIQVILRLFNQPNENLRRFGQKLALYTYQLIRYLTYNTEYKPFPFGEWPNLEFEDESANLDYAPSTNDETDNTTQSRD